MCEYKVHINFVRHSHREKGVLQNSNGVAVMLLFIICYIFGDRLYVEIGTIVEICAILQSPSSRREWIEMSSSR